MVTLSIIERVDCFKFLGMITSNDLGWEKQHRCCREKGSTKAVLHVATKEVRAEEGDSCSVLSFCYWLYSCILNMCMVRQHQPVTEEQA